MQHEDGFRPHLDHVVVMMDGDAYRQALESPFIGGHFGRFKVKQANSTLAGAYTSAGIAGQNTLIELFDVDKPPVAGTIGGLVFSFERPGAIGEARRRLDERGAAFKHELVERAVEGQERKQPWYNLVRPDLGENSPFLLMLGEVTPEYFERIGARRGPNGELHRRGYLDAALGMEMRPEHHLRDITDVDVRLRSERARRVDDTLQALGYASADEDGARVLRGPEVTIRIHADDQEPEGVLAIRMALARPADAVVHHFGETSALELQGDSAVWTFTPPTPARVAEPEPELVATG